MNSGLLVMSIINININAFFRVQHHTARSGMAAVLASSGTTARDSLVACVERRDDCAARHSYAVRSVGD